MTREPRPSKVPPHAFDEDQNMPADATGRRWCTCGLPGEAGDDRHPAGAPPLHPTLLPPVPEPAREFDRRQLGERPDVREDAA